MLPTHALLLSLSVGALFALSPLPWSPSFPSEGAQPTKQAAPVKSMTPDVAAKSSRDDAAAEKLGWRLGFQCWTFRDRTTEEAIDVARRMGVKYMEIYSGQVVSKGDPEVKVGVDMTAEQRDSLKKKFAAAGVKPVSFGVVGFKNDEADARKTFEFAKAMGLENIACEPDPDAWPLLDKLATEYGINLACHNHPDPSRYWNPDTVLSSQKGLGKRLGACADTGHWKRSKLVPVDCLKKLEGRIFELHFKDIAEGKDKPWGTGDCEAAAMLKELHRQGYKGPIFVEYEDGAGTELEQNVAKCVEFFDKTAGEIAGDQKGGR